MKKAVIFVNGDTADYSRILTHIDKDTLLIGCDGGTQHMLALGLIPHVVVGDFDSLSPKVQKALERTHIELIRYPEEKSHTDSELCVMLAQERGCRTVILTGVRGSHTDHMMGNFLLLANKEFAALSMKIVEGDEEIVLVREHARITGKKDDMISLLPVGVPVKGVVTRGLLYPLKNETLVLGSTRSLRNCMTGKRADITLQKGAVIMVHRFA